MKKLLNNKVMRMMIALGMFAFAGCQDYSIDSQPDAAPNIQEDALESYEMTAESAPSVVFNISANTPWRVESDSQWCKVSPSMSAVGGLVSEVMVTVDDNEDYSPRTAILTISGVEISYSKTISIVQNSKTDFIVTEFGGTIDAEGGVATYRIRTNKKWEYFAVDDFLYGAADVESAEDVDAVADYELNITVPANTGVRRSCRFLLRTAAGDYEYSFSQNGITLELAEDQTVEDLTFSAEDVPAYGAGATVTFLVKSNIAFVPVVADSDADWLEITNYDATSVTVKTKGSVNPYLTARKGTINLTAGEVDPVPVTVYQPAGFTMAWPVYSVDHLLNSYEENEDNSVTFYFDSVTSNVFASNYGGALGTWTIEFDSERSEFNNLLHLMIYLGENPGESTDNYYGYRSAITAHDCGFVTGNGGGNYNNFGQHINYHWSLAPGRRNFDGYGVGGTSVPPAGEPVLKADDINHLEKIEYTYTKTTFTMTIYANGGQFGVTHTVTDSNGRIGSAIKKMAVNVHPVPSNGAGHTGHTSYEGTYVTITKAYFTPAE